MSLALGLIAVGLVFAFTAVRNKKPAGGPRGGAPAQSFSTNPGTNGTAAGSIESNSAPDARAQTDSVSAPMPDDDKAFLESAFEKLEHVGTENADEIIAGIAHIVLSRTFSEAEVRQYFGSPRTAAAAASDHYMSYAYAWGRDLVFVLDRGVVVDVLHGSRSMRQGTNSPNVIPFYPWHAGVTDMVPRSLK